jgi:hypothetical protein
MEPSRPRIALLALAAIFASPAYPQSSEDPTALLDRARQKIAATTQRLLKCTCLETIERTYYAAPAPKMNPRIMTDASANSCDGKAFGANGPLSLEAKDRLRLGVTSPEIKRSFLGLPPIALIRAPFFNSFPPGPSAWASLEPI